MPTKNTIKNYIEGGIYYIYNAGVGGLDIFIDKEDYLQFLKFMQRALSVPPDKSTLKKEVKIGEKSFEGVPRQPKNFSQNIKLIAFSLNPREFHLIIKQKDPKVMEKFMRSLGTRYSMYFNKQHGRKGRLFQGVYKAVLVEDNDQLLYLTKYLHSRPLEDKKSIDQAFTSYPVYSGKAQLAWVETKTVLDYLKQKIFPMNRTYKSYEEFIKDDNLGTEFLENLTLAD